MIVASKVDPIFLIHGKSPRTHLRGEEPIELPGFTCIRIDAEEEKGGFILSKGEVNRIIVSSFSRADMGSPDDGLFNGDAKITKSKRSFGKRGQQDQNEEWDEELNIRQDPHRIM